MFRNKIPETLLDIAKNLTKKCGIAQSEVIAGSVGGAALLLTYPYMAASIKWAGFAFLLFIAWQLARSHPHVTRVAGHLKCTTEGRNRGVQNTPLLGYIGTEIAYIQSGYRSSPACRWSIRKPNRR